MVKATKIGRPRKDIEFVEKKSRKEVMAMSEEEKKAYKQARNRQAQRAFQEKKAKVVPVVKTEATKTLQAAVRRKLTNASGTPPNVSAGEVPVILPVPVPMPVPVTGEIKQKLDKLEKVQAKARELLAKREIGKKNESAMKIQTAFRARKAKKDVKDMLDSVRKLQAVFARKPVMDIMLPNIRAEVQRKKYEEGYAKRMADKAQNKANKRT